MKTHPDENAATKGLFVNAGKKAPRMKTLGCVKAICLSRAGSRCPEERIQSMLKLFGCALGGKCAVALKHVVSMLCLDKLLSRMKEGRKSSGF